MNRKFSPLLVCLFLIALPAYGAPPVPKVAQAAKPPATVPQRGPASEVKVGGIADMIPIEFAAGFGPMINGGKLLPSLCLSGLAMVEGTSGFAFGGEVGLLFSLSPMGAGFGFMPSANYLIQVNRSARARAGLSLGPIFHASRKRATFGGFFKVGSDFAVGATTHISVDIRMGVVEGLSAVWPTASLIFQL